MNCHDVKDRLTEGRATAAVRRHLSGCSDCSSFAKELDSGGSLLAESMLSVVPSPGFEDRLAVRLREKEISARVMPRSRASRLLVPALFALLLLSGYLMFRPAPAIPPVKVAAPPVITERRENPFTIDVRRQESAGPTSLALGFAGQHWVAPFAGDVEHELLLAWALGARRAEVTFGPRIPTREVEVLVQLLDRAGYAWNVRRPK